MKKPTELEKKILMLTMEGYSARKIAEVLGCSPNTVYKVRSIYRKHFGTFDQLEAVRESMAYVVKIAREIEICYIKRDYEKISALAHEIVEGVKVLARRIDALEKAFILMNRLMRR